MVGQQSRREGWESLVRRIFDWLNLWDWFALPRIILSILSQRPFSLPNLQFSATGYALNHHPVFFHFSLAFPSLGRYYPNRVLGPGGSKRILEESIRILWVLSTDTHTEAPEIGQIWLGLNLTRIKFVARFQRHVFQTTLYRSGRIKNVIERFSQEYLKRNQRYPDLV